MSLPATLPQTSHGGYPPYSTTQELIAAVNAAIATRDRATIIALATELDYRNNGIH